MRSAIIFLVLLFSSSSVYSATIHVPASYLKIQDAIDAASNGDIIIVAPGKYIENLDFKGKAITVESSGAPAMTIIDGGNPIHPDFGSCVMFISGEGTDSTIDGFTITNGVGYFNSLSIAREGGGVYCSNSSNPTITNNIITENTLISSGGGIFCKDSSPIITNNIINKNQAGYRGCGIYCQNSNAVISFNEIQKNIDTNNFTSGGGIYYEGNVTISDNIIDGNIAESGGGLFGKSSGDITRNIVINNSCVAYGGGAYCLVDAPGVFKNNLISSNSAYQGGGICCYMTDGTFENNVIANNKAANGGGIFSGGSVYGKFYNNTISRNSASLSGGGIYSNTYSSHPEFTNCIIWGNSSPEGHEISLINSNIFTISYSNVEGGKSEVYIETGSTLFFGANMIDQKPAFFDPWEDDFHLLHNSPCINMGDDSVSPGDDIDGDSRPYMGTVDMGADEFIGDHLLGADVFIISASTGGTVNFYLFGGAPNGGRSYLMLGSISGTAPGFILPAGKAIVPIKWDPFTDIVIMFANTPLFNNFIGSLSWGSSTGFAAFDVVSPMPSSMAGLTLSFAYALNKPWDFASNPINVLITP